MVPAWCEVSAGRGSAVREASAAEAAGRRPATRSPLRTDRANTRKEGPRTVTVKDVPGDILVKITTTNICGSDLHMYEGRTSFETGRTLGHENLGQVVEVGSVVSKVKVGDWVVLPFNIACGVCKRCEQGLTNYCLTMQPEPDMAGAAYGFAEMGPYQGGQAELLRVPYGDFNALRLGEDAAERQLDYVMLADTFPHRRPDHRLRSRSGRPHGRLLRDPQGRRPRPGRRPPARPAPDRRGDRRRRRQHRRAGSGRGRQGSHPRPGRGQRLRTRRWRSTWRPGSCLRQRSSAEETAPARAGGSVPPLNGPRH